MTYCFWGYPYKSLIIPGFCRAFITLPANSVWLSVVQRHANVSAWCNLCHSLHVSSYSDVILGQLPKQVNQTLQLRSQTWWKFTEYNSELNDFKCEAFQAQQ